MQGGGIRCKLEKCRSGCERRLPCGRAGDVAARRGPCTPPALPRERHEEAKPQPSPRAHCRISAVRRRRRTPRIARRPNKFSKNLRDLQNAPCPRSRAPGLRRSGRRCAHQENGPRAGVQHVGLAWRVAKILGSFGKWSPDVAPCIPPGRRPRGEGCPRRLSAKKASPVARDTSGTPGSCLTDLEHTRRPGGSIFAQSRYRSACALRSGIRIPRAHRHRQGHRPRCFSTITVSRPAVHGLRLFGTQPTPLR